MTTPAMLQRSVSPYANIGIEKAYDPMYGYYDYYMWRGDPNLAPGVLKGALGVEYVHPSAPESERLAASARVQELLRQNREAAADLNTRLLNPDQYGNPQPMAMNNQFAPSARVQTQNPYTGPGSTLGRGPNQQVQSPGSQQPMSYSLGGWTGNTPTRPMAPSGSNMGMMPSQVGMQAQPMGADQSWLSQQGGAFNPYRPEQINTSPGGYREFPRGNADGSVSGGFTPYGGAGTPQPMSGGGNPMFSGFGMPNVNSLRDMDMGGGMTQSQRNGGALGRPTQINTSPGGLREFPRGNANGSVSGGYYPPQQQPPSMTPPSYQGGGMSGGGGFSSTGYAGIAPAGYGSSSSYGQAGQPQRYQFGSVNGSPFGNQPPANIMNNLFGQGSALGQMFR